MKKVKKNAGKIFLTMIAILAVSACSKDDDLNIVSNDGNGSVQSSQVIAASPAVQKAYASKYTFEFNDAGLLSTIRDATTGKIEATYEYGSSTRSTTGNSLSSNQVLMTIYQTDVYIFKCLFSIGKNGYANSCTQTYTWIGENYTCKYSYNADKYLVKITEDEDYATFKYDNNGRLSSLYEHLDDGSKMQATFTYGSAFYTPNKEEFPFITQIDKESLPENVIVSTTDYVPNSLGLFTIINDPRIFEASEFTSFDPEFTFAYLAGLIGRKPNELPAKVHIDYFGDISNIDYAYLYLIVDGQTEDYHTYEIYDAEGNMSYLR